MNIVYHISCIYMYLHYIERTFRFLFIEIYIYTYIYILHTTQNTTFNRFREIYISISIWKDHSVEATPEDYSHANRILEGLAPQPTKNDPFYGWLSRWCIGSSFLLRWELLGVFLCFFILPQVLFQFFWKTLWGCVIPFFLGNIVWGGCPSCSCARI